MKKRLKEYAIGILGGQCIICGYSKSLRALHFHHIDESLKDVEISKLSSEYDVRQEAKKCILVCSNCHCEIHDNYFPRAELKIIHDNQLKLLIKNCYSRDS